MPAVRIPEISLETLASSVRLNTFKCVTRHVPSPFRAALQRPLSSQSRGACPPGTPGEEFGRPEACRATCSAN